MRLQSPRSLPLHKIVSLQPRGPELRSEEGPVAREAQETGPEREAGLLEAEGLWGSVRDRCWLSRLLPAVCTPGTLQAGSLTLSRLCPHGASGYTGRGEAATSLVGPPLPRRPRSVPPASPIWLSASEPLPQGLQGQKGGRPPGLEPQKRVFAQPQPVNHPTSPASCSPVVDMERCQRQDTRAGV